MAEVVPVDEFVTDGRYPGSVGMTAIWHDVTNPKPALPRPPRVSA
jgi:hypothetical protein